MAELLARVEIIHDTIERRGNPAAHFSSEQKTGRKMTMTQRIRRSFYAQKIFSRNLNAIKFGAKRMSCFINDRLLLKRDLTERLFVQNNEAGLLPRLHRGDHHIGGERVGDESFGSRKRDLARQ